MSIDIFSLTQKQYVETVFHSLGKGRQIAALVYSTWFKEGRHPIAGEYLESASILLDQIIALTDFSIDSNFEQRGSKWLQTYPDKLQSESVEIQMKFGMTLCVSSQVGCRMGCAFCETGRLGLIRNLTVKQIVLQLFYAKVIRKQKIKNIVFMGMGEPLDNFEAVKQAILIFTDPFGFGLGPSKICVSTSGLVDVLSRFIDEVDPRVRLAVSINGSSDAVRSKVMPVNKRFDMASLKNVLLRYQQSHEKRTLLFEYVLLANVTDQLSMVDDLAKFCEGFNDLRINVIPYNPQSRPTFQTPSEESIQAFMKQLRSHGFAVYLRTTKGEKEMAACGQLGNLKLKSAKRALVD